METVTYRVWCGSEGGALLGRSTGATVGRGRTGSRALGVQRARYNGVGTRHTERPGPHHRR